MQKTTSLRISFHPGHRDGGSTRQRQDLHCKETHQVLDVLILRHGVLILENAFFPCFSAIQRLLFKNSQYPFVDHCFFIFLNNALKRTKCKHSQCYDKTPGTLTGSE